MQIGQYSITKRTNLGWSENQTGYVLRTPRSYKQFSTYEEAKEAFNKMAKAKAWMLLISIDGKTEVYVNQPINNPYCTVCDNI